MTGAGQTFISASVGGIAERLASRVTRRSFLGRVGRFALVLAESGTLLGAISKGAQATLLGPCDCSNERGCDSGCTGSRPCPTNCANPPPTGGCDHSISCKGLVPGTNGCPTGSTHCGHWACSCTTCTSGVSRWHDCCDTANQCASSSTCSCDVLDTDGVRRPTCCFKRCYNGNNYTACSYIVCRYRTCAP
jgi:hypothetical protein